MTRTNLLRASAAALGVGAVLAIGLWRISEARADADHDADQGRPAAARPATETEPGVIALDRDGQARAGIEVAPLQVAAMQGQTTAYATVVDPARLTELANADAAAKAQLDAAAAKAEASRQAYDRAKLLYNDDQNTSLAQLQAAEAAAGADQAALVAARSQALTARAAAAQELGPVLARNLGGGPAQSLIQRRSFLVQVTASPGEAASRPATSVTLQAAGGGRVTARLLDAAPRVDPKLQAMSFYYLAPAAPGLEPGMNLTVTLVSGAAHMGAAVPASAVVSWQGQSWVYLRTGAERFRRVALGADAAATEDGYVTDALQPGAVVVAHGAQLLLSQEFKPQGSATADED